MDEKIAPYQALRRSKQDEIARRVQIRPMRCLSFVGGMYP